MYARGMIMQDIASTIEDIYGFSISRETISEIIDCVLQVLEEWKKRPLKKLYPFVFSGLVF